MNNSIIPTRRTFYICILFQEKHSNATTPKIIYQILSSCFTTIVYIVGEIPYQPACAKLVIWTLTNSSQSEGCFLVCPVHDLVILSSSTPPPFRNIQILGVSIWSRYRFKIREQFISRYVPAPLTGSKTFRLNMYCYHHFPYGFVMIYRVYHYNNHGCAHRGPGSQLASLRELRAKYQGPQIFKEIACKEKFRVVIGIRSKIFCISFLLLRAACNPAQYG